MKISLALPSYNYGKYIESCLASIINQDYQDYEILIADGGSTDETLTIIQRYVDKDSRFRLVSKMDNGQADAIKIAFGYASGDIFCFLNADDCYLCHDTFSCVVNNFKNYEQVSLISFGGYYLDASGRWLKPIHYRYHPFDGFHLMKYRTAVIQPATFWRKDVYINCNWPAEFNFVFDVVFFYNAYLKYSWLELAKPVAGYRLHGDNKSMSVKSNRVNELAKFEAIKFGKNSWRSSYLSAIANLVNFFENLGVMGRLVNKIIYLFVNTLAFITCYRTPSI